MLTLTISLERYKFLLASPVPLRTKHLSRGKSAERPKYSLQRAITSHVNHCT